MFSILYINVLALDLKLTHQLSSSGVLRFNDEGVDLVDDALLEAVAEDLDLARVAAALRVDRERGVRQRGPVVLDVDLVLALLGRGVTHLSLKKDQFFQSLK